MCSKQLSLLNKPKTVQPTQIPYTSLVVELVLRVYSMVYFDDILVYSKTLNDHMEHLRRVFEFLREYKFYANTKKCTFAIDQVGFLGYVVSVEGIKLDSSKVQAILEWPLHKSISEVRNFHCLAIFYKRFIQNFSSIAAPLIDCLKQKNLVWSIQANGSFAALKKALAIAPVL